MDWIIATSLALKLGLAIVALAALLWFSVYVDKRRGIDYMRDVLPILEKDPVGFSIWRSARWLGMCLVIGMLLSGCGSPAAAAVFPSTYDKQIQAASARYLPGMPWRLLKAQFYQESRLRPDARSPAGALGIAQFMPATWDEVSKAMKFGVVDRRMVEPAVLGGAYYMATLRTRWTMDDMDRHRFALAGYNAGNGNIRRAARACGWPMDWKSAAQCLPAVTGRHSAETIGYVEVIFGRWWPAMELVR